MTDIFAEVEEQLRSARYQTLALKALPWVGGLLVLALIAALAVWGVSNHEAKVDATASETYAAALDTLQTGDKAQAYAQFDTAAKAGSKAYATLALMQQGGIRLSENRTKDAVALFDAAAKTATSPFIGDLASLQAVYALLDDSSVADIEARLKPLMVAGAPYRFQAQEALAMSKLAHGQGKAARDDFSVLATGLDTPEGIRQRATVAQTLIDGGGDSALPAIIKAAEALPTPAAQMARPPSPDAQQAPSTPQAGAGQ